MSDEGRPVYSKRGEWIGSLYERSDGATIYDRHGQKAAEIDREGRIRWVRNDWVRILVERDDEDC